MNTNQLKTFAREARRKLLDQVSARLAYVRTAQNAELLERRAQIDKLNEALQHRPADQLVEQVAYTWFNRLVALRFLDANDFQPLGLRVLTPQPGYTLPQLLDAAKRGELPEQLQLDRRRLNDLLDGRLPAANPQNEAYRLLLTAACNHLHQTFPFLFEPIDDYSELLLPEDLTSPFAIVHDVVQGMPEADCQQVEIIGWLYQFYIAEKKDAVYASKQKFKKEDIPAATQLFTPRWIVEYLVQNSLGKLWLQIRPNSPLKTKMQYLIPPTEEPNNSRAQAPLPLGGGDGGGVDTGGADPTKIRLLDPACGSGHILVYAFDLLAAIYEEEGYAPADIPGLILQHNLFGLEIDERAAQLAGLALLLKARQYHPRAFRQNLRPQISWLQPLTLDETAIRNCLDELKLPGAAKLMDDLRLLQQADTFGSLIRPQSSLPDIQQAQAALDRAAAQTNLFAGPAQDQLRQALDNLLALRQQYHCVVANPPYLGSGNMNKTLSDWVKKQYPDSKADLMTCFIERNLDFALDSGLIGMITLPSWMFLSTFEAVRTKLISSHAILSLLHMGRGIFGIDWGSSAFIVHKNQIAINPGYYFRLHKRNFQHIYYEDIEKIFLLAKAQPELKINFEKYREGEAISAIEDIVDENGQKIAFTANQQDFAKIPGSPVGYWVSPNFLNAFSSPKIEKIASTRLGMATADNYRFVRFNWEVGLNDINKNAGSCDSAEKSKKTWFLYAKGGPYRKWYGNIEHIVNWKKNGQEIRNFKNEHGVIRSHNYNLEFIFKPGITWSALSSGSASFRILDKALFDNSGSSLFLNDESQIYYLIGLLNSNIITRLLSTINPTLNYQPGAIASLPVISSNKINIGLISDSIGISIRNWNTYETSLDFNINEIIKLGNKNNLEIEEAYDMYQQYWKTKFFQLHKNEEELNRQFIEIYGLQEELSPEVPLEEVTILQEETRIKNGRLVFDAKEVFTQFVSYFVGCLFGRYSLDREGLVLANQGETLEDYLEKVGKPAAEVQFLPDADNIVPVLDDAWFEDDIVGQFQQFLRATFGEQNFAKNMAFVEDCLGKDLRSYFVRDFYNDHVRRYKKRPIYWLFSSPGGAFNALVYLHRYTPDTLNLLLNRYLRAFRDKLRTRLEHLQAVQATGSPTERSKALREAEKIERQLLDIDQYEREVLYPLATERIALDLDNGVLVNYNKLGRAVKEVSGLNDKKAKAKVRGFDWIDTGAIRD